MADKLELFADKISKDVIEIAEKAKAVQKDYAYLDDEISLEVWAWEFTRRNPKYITLYNDIANDFRTIDILQGDTDLEDIHDNITSVHCPIKEKMYRLSTDFGILGSLFRGKEGKPHDADNFMNIDKFDFLIEIPNPTKGYNQFCRKTPEIEGTKCVKSFTLTVDNEYSFVIDNRYINHSSFFADNCRELIMDKLPPVDPSDTIYFGVSMSGKKSEIMQQVGRILDQKLKPVKKRSRDDKWKYHLIVYDLYNKGNKYSDISLILATAFEEEITVEDVKDLTDDERENNKDSRSLFQEKTIENYYKNALVLINGEYKKNHLFLKK